MATTIVTKSGSGAPETTDLVAGELAVDLTNKRLYTENGSAAIIEVGSNPYNFTANHDGSAKLATTATGIDVTGTVTADGLTVGDTSASQSLIQMLANPTNGANTIHFGDGTSADAYVGYINYAHDSNSMQFQTGGSERLRIDSVGTTSIKTDGTTQLILNRADASIQAANQVAQILVTGDDPSASQSGAAISFIAGDAWATNSYPTNITFSNDLSGTLTERMRIDSIGNVGINTSDPQKTLDVKGTFAISNSTTSYWDFDRDDSDGSLKIADTGTERMRIDADGNLLVGRTGASGLGKLNVEGGADFTGGDVYLCRDSGDVGIGTAAGGNKLVVKRDGTTSGVNSQIVSENRTGAAGQYALFASSLDNGSGSGFKPIAFGAVQTSAVGRTADFVIAVSDTDNVDISADERMRIDSGGNAGIGKSTSSVVRLSVAGVDATASNYAFEATNSSSATKFIVRNDGWASFYKSDNSASMTIDASGHVTMPYQPAFQVKPASTQADIAIDTNVVVVWGTEVFDVGANFSASEFTAPVTGKYQLNAHLLVGEVDTAADYYQLQIQTSNRIYYDTMDPAIGAADYTYQTLNQSVLADMDAGDTAHVVIYQQAGTAQSDLNVTTCVFSGYLVA